MQERWAKILIVRENLKEKVLTFDKRLPKNVYVFKIK